MSEDKRIVPMNDSFDEEESCLYIKSYMFIKGYAIAKDLKQTEVALALARRLHAGQYRKDGAPYIQHPLKVCTTLISYGVEDDATLAGALLHDILEDCQDKLPLNGRELMTEYKISKEVFEIVTILTKESGLDQHELSLYFDRIKSNPKAALIKLSDRLHNSSTLYTYKPERMRKYIQETYTFLLPMASYCKAFYPDYANAFAILKSNIYSLNHSMDIMMSRFEEWSAQKSPATVEKTRADHNT